MTKFQDVTYWEGRKLFWTDKCSLFSGNFVWNMFVWNKVCMEYVVLGEFKSTKTKEM
jgi:hypothetical protein